MKRIVHRDAMMIVCNFMKKEQTSGSIPRQGPN